MLQSFTTLWGFVLDGISACTMQETTCLSGMLVVHWSQKLRSKNWSQYLSQAKLTWIVVAILDWRWTGSSVKLYIAKCLLIENISELEAAPTAAALLRPCKQVKVRRTIALQFGKECCVQNNGTISGQPRGTSWCTWWNAKKNMNIQVCSVLGSNAYQFPWKSNLAHKSLFTF